MQVFVITTKMNVEFSNGEFSTWDVFGRNLYAFKTIEDAKEEIQTLRQEEVLKYRKWLKKPKNCFLHHTYSIEMIPVFENW